MLQAERENKGGIKYRYTSRVCSPFVESLQHIMWRPPFVSPRVSASNSIAPLTVLNYFLYPRHTWRMLWLAKVSQPEFMWCFALLYWWIKQMTGNVNVNIEAPGWGKYWGLRDSCMERKKRRFSFFFFFEGEVIKCICLTGAYVYTRGTKRNEYFWPSPLKCLLFALTVIAKYFLGAILSVLQVIQKKYPWSDWNRLYW